MTDEDVPELQSIWDEAKGHIDRDEYDKAVEIYNYVLIRYSDHEIAVGYANAYLGDIFLTTRRLDLAEKHLLKAIALVPSKAHYHYLLGFTYSLREQWRKAVFAFRNSIRLDPDNGEYERGLGWAMFNAGSRAEGISHLFRALELFPLNVHAMTDLAAAMLLMGNLKKAREYAQKALELEPGYMLAQNLIYTIDQIQTNPG
jgi:tetratricopeptide (TPR) repeat protein